MKPHKGFHFQDLSGVLFRQFGLQIGQRTQKAMQYPLTMLTKIGKNRIIHKLYDIKKIYQQYLLLYCRR